MSLKLPYHDTPDILLRKFAGEEIAEQLKLAAEAARILKMGPLVTIGWCEDGAELLTQLGRDADRLIRDRVRLTKERDDAREAASFYRSACLAGEKVSPLTDLQMRRKFDPGST